MKIVISDNDHINLQQEEEVFAEAGMTYTLYQCKTQEDVMEQLQEAEIVLNQYAPFTRRVFQALPNLKQIVRYGVGVDNIDCKAAEEFGVQVCNVPDYGMNEVADQAMALLLSLVRKTVIMSNHTKQFGWNYAYGIPIHRIPGQTVGIVGLGRIGRTFAKRMTGFECRLIACDPRYEIGSVVNDAEIVSFEELVRQADMISIHCPLDPTTKNLFNRQTFSEMKPTSYLVNTARGGIVNEEDLYWALSEGIISGAALDVVQSEPLETTNRLCTLENFLCSPHGAWYSEESAKELKRKAAQEAVRFAKGEKVWYPVNEPKRSV